jgi:hypothetical protein
MPNYSNNILGMNWLYYIPLVLFIFASNYFTNFIGDKFYKKKHIELYDMSHILLPDLHDYRGVYDTLFFLFMFSVILLSNKCKVEFIRELIIIYFIRSITIILTILPKDGKCEYKSDLFTHISRGCFDKIFSGHTTFVMLLTLFLMREKYINLPTLIGINSANILSILAVRSHYSVDVLLAGVITFFVYKWPHALLK